MSKESRWYQMSVAEVIKSLTTDESGLTSTEAAARLGKYGYNELKFKKRSAWIRLLLQFHSPLIYVLLVSAAFTGFLGMWIDTGVILAVVLANTAIGFIQEGRAEASIESLKKMLVPTCTVLRDGEPKGIQARELVPGDVVILEEGDRIPADLRLFIAKNLHADEATLTGESVPVRKDTAPIEKPALPPADQQCMAFSGTFITRGSGRGIVIGTGISTEIGRIASLITETQRETAAPLIRKVAQFTKVLIIAVLALAIINLLFGIFLGGYDLIYSFLASVSLAVAAIPEGLPAILTIALAAGARVMVRHNTLIRKLPAVETLGSTTVICSDKTGTLTRGEMTVLRAYSGGKDYAVTGSGYNPEGEFLLEAKQVDPKQDSTLSRLLTAGLLCNNASLEKTDEGYKLSGDPTEGALVVSAMKAAIKDDSKRLDEIPFESENQYMVTLHKNEKDNVIYVKGSPERVLEMCSTQLLDGKAMPVDYEKMRQISDEMASQALRVLGFAYRKAPAGKQELETDDVKDLVFLGFQGMLDPPREEAIDAIAKCGKAGIRVVMATGDHAETARAIAGMLGLPNERAITGEDLEKMDDKALAKDIDKVSIYARVAPAHKFRIVTMLQQRGNIVAVTGDGVNDAPALKSADLGVAMGIKGTEVSKDASDMVLTDDNFASIVAAVEEGRHVYENIRKVILYTLPTNGGQALLVMGAIALAAFLPLFSTRLPLEPVQILWINLYDAIVLALPLLWEPHEKGLLERPPRNPKEPIANALFFRKVGLVSVLMAASGFGVFYHFGLPAVQNGQVDELLLSQAQTAVLINIMLIHIFYLMTARSLSSSAFKMNPFSNKWIIGGIGVTVILQLLLIYILPQIGFNPLRVASFPGSWWPFIILLALPGLLLVELEEVVAEWLKSKRDKASRK